MNSYSIIQLSTLVVYVPLVLLILGRRRTRLQTVFLVYLIASVGWSLSSFLAHADFSSQYASVWMKFVPLVASWTIVAYAHFVDAFVASSTTTLRKVGYGYLAALAVLVAAGFIPRSVVDEGNGLLAVHYGPWLYYLTLGGACFIGLATYRLVKTYRSARDPQSRNRIVYLMAGLGFLVIFGILFTVQPPPRYPIDHIGHLCNALFITYAILRYQLLDVKLVVRKGLVYSVVTVCITAVYLLLLLSLHYLLEGWTASAGLGAMVGVALLMAWLFNPLRATVQKLVDRVFYGERYDYRQMVLNFAREMSNVLDLDELAEAMLQSITRAVRASQASLLLHREDDFSSHYAKRLVEGEPVMPVKLSEDSPIVNWLKREEGPLLRDLIDVAPEFKALWEVERNALVALDIEVLCPIKSKGSLIGILALSKKQSGGIYSGDDMSLLMTLATEAAVAIENAQLYNQAKQRAHTDELTGLYNHRYFHERLDEEITRCTRFGEIFSLMFLDLDLFKAYNDIYGHLEGDEVLRDVGKYIQTSMRGIDMAFRYGGDEFTVVLPQASLDDARRIAERVRKKIEVEMDSRGAPLSCSIGVASWPTDGVMREEIVRSADAALYQAKQSGRDRVCLYSEVGPSELVASRVGPDSEPGILSTIYALAATVDAKDSYTYGHSKKVAKYATDIAEALGYVQERIATLRAAALLHDIGKIGVSDELLVKAGPLSAEDWEPIRSHPKLGVAIIKHVESLSGCLAAIQYHHERFDGTGYPAGLKGENIPLDARILAVADTYDAMTSLRPYRHGKFTHEQALAEVERCAGTQFDPKIVDAFVRVYERSGAKVSRAKRGLALGPKEV
jgi:diguanylate cyclase (GGDEF)-like protein/putative nucleotidyltransferase with HDIG domain